jgi:hypothetical protein
LVLLTCRRMGKSWKHMALIEGGRDFRRREVNDLDL